jgi:prolyl-tRNA synthetase
MAAAVEQNHDDKGIIWPAPIAPYDIYLCPLRMDNPHVAETAEKLYSDLVSAGFDVLFDDRVVSAGIKFKDADLIGIPVRLTLSERTLQNNSIEIKRRDEKETRVIPLDDLSSEIDKALHVHA